jgi:hypothetical protein
MTRSRVIVGRAQLKTRRVPLVMAEMLALVAGLWAGVLRLAVQLPISPEMLPGVHGPLMVCGFLGTLISLERSVAIGAAWAYASPVMTAVGALMLVAGIGGMSGSLLITLGSVALIVNFASILRHDVETFTITMMLGAIAWLVGNIMWLVGWPIPDLVSWWSGYPVLTICGERLELSRMRGPAQTGRRVFVPAAALFVAGLCLSPFAPESGLRVLGIGAAGLGAWIMIFDVARRTICLPGLPRFAAVNLLLGAAWLTASGTMRTIFPVDLTTLQYDAILHSMFLGFVFSMIFAHAPIIFPAILGKPLPFRKLFYTHVVLFQASLALRVGGDLAGWFWGWRWGGVLNVAAVIAFLILTAASILRGAPEIGSRDALVLAPDAARVSEG